jgi:hypothetical protein
LAQLSPCLFSGYFLELNYISYKNQYNKVIKRRSECRLYKLTGRTGGQAGRRARQILKGCASKNDHNFRKEKIQPKTLIKNKQDKIKVTVFFQRLKVD